MGFRIKGLAEVASVFLHPGAAKRIAPPEAFLLTILVRLAEASAASAASPLHAGLDSDREVGCEQLPKVHPLLDTRAIRCEAGDETKSAVLSLVMGDEAIAEGQIGGRE